jgi:hypothetical protein
MCGGLTFHRWFTSKYTIFNKIYIKYTSNYTSVEGVEGVEGKYRIQAIKIKIKNPIL